MNILVAMDSSASAHAALVATLARRWPEGTDFRVLTVIPGKLRDRFSGGQIGADLFQAHRLVDVATGAIEIRNIDSVVTGEIDVGNPTKTITRMADSWPADLVIVGSHDRPALGRFFMGSVSKAILHKANCSVLVARDSGYGTADGRPMNRVMLAIDDSPYSKAAVNSILNAKWPEKTKFYILSVCNPMYSGFTYEPSAISVFNSLEIQDEYRREVGDMVRGVAHQFENVFGPGRVEYDVKEGSAENVILESARDWRPDLIVVGSHGRPNMATRLLGSVSHAVAMQADCSVQVVRSSVAQLKRVKDRSAESMKMPSASGF
ncbi:MAG: universal stress protein [Candidatus Melainabacteria bacterium]|nr:universal stress protein [Candidatus Melainabacteria bacterium]